MQTSGTTLRERNRLATWEAIHLAAYELVLERGLADVTVEDVVAAAGVSRRTFFNYFATKEDAVLGLRPPVLSDELTARFEQADTRDLLTQTVELLGGVFRSTTSFESRQRQHRVVARCPELRARVLHYVTQAEQLVQDYLAAHWTELPQPAGAVGTLDKARALVMLAGSVLRYASTHYTVTSEAERDRAVERAIATFREVIQESL